VILGLRRNVPTCLLTDNVHVLLWYGAVVYSGSEKVIKITVQSTTAQVQGGPKKRTLILFLGCQLFWTTL